jgi:CheY-specific phosphatase CheX
MDAQVRARLGEIVAVCARELFGAFGVALTGPGDADEVPPIAGDATMAVVGFAGDQMRGSLTLYAPDAVFARSLVSASGEFAGDPSVDAQGWAAEFSNLLLGRVKRELLGYGAVLQMSTPTAFGGQDLAVHVADPAECIVARFEADGAPVCVLFRALIEPGFELAPLPQAPPVAPEGDPMFF